MVKDSYAGNDSIDFAYYGVTLWRWKGFLVSLLIVAVASALVGSLIASPRYQSKLTILGPVEESFGGNSPFLNVVSQLPGLGLGMPSMTRNQDLFVSILDSRTLAQNVVMRYRLPVYYKVSTVQDAVEMLQEASAVSVSREGLISVTVEDHDPRIAAELANAHADALEKFLSQMDLGTASRKRRFIADQLTKHADELQQAENALMQFQEQNQAVSLPEQSRGAMEFAATLKANIAMKQVQLETVRSFATDSNPQVVQLKHQIDELKRQLAQSQFGAGLDLPSISEGPDLLQSSRKEIHLAAVDVPKVGLELARLTRNVKVREQVYGMLLQQYEQVKIAEARDMPEVQVLDRATPPAEKFRPRTLRNMMVSAVLSVLVGIVLVFLLEFIDREKSSAELLPVH